MRLRNQHGCLRCTRRKTGPSCWEFLWRENDADGNRTRGTAVIGTVEQFPTRDLAEAAANGLRMSINQDRNRQREQAIVVADLVDHYIETELSDEADWHSHATRIVYGEFLKRWVRPYCLSEHPKAAIHEHLKSGHTFRRNVQDIDSSGRVSSLSQYGECLEGREETANHSVGTTGMVSAKDPAGHASTSRDHQRLSARRRCGNMAAGKVETRR